MKLDYGVRALIDLAQQQGDGLAQCRDIAARQSVPEPFLDQVLTNLRKGGLIHSRRGPRGGHALARSPQEISLADVARILEGNQACIGCLEARDDFCSRTGSCAQQEVWQQVEDATLSVLRATSIGDLAERQQEIADGAAQSSS